MEVKCNITTIEAFDKAVIDVNEKLVKNMSKEHSMSGFIVGMTNMIFAEKLKKELFGEKEVEE